ncbi:hypothetical protein NDU88_007222 [Pleurodeles waltl]|uniref:Uncharacterized protein n=1 Tax=Pleurodeles waltl TaxID=8319 RepID=A0AAV7N5B2_PLEWA|nr:hypothetical protein NDU88_007221 [Pleurodeles waltl]KAJ1109865.1 hypothetical protein NDU88_007222 [Pleurodeles waltl]
MLRLNKTLGRPLPCNLEVCLLGDFCRPKKHKTGSRFLDLALALARRRIAIHCKAKLGPSIEAWAREVTQGSRAEESVLRREGEQGLRRCLIAELWSEVLESWECPEGDMESDHSEYSRDDVDSTTLDMN